MEQFFLTVLTDLQARKTSSQYILKLSRCFIPYMTVGANTVDDSGALCSIVGKYRGQDFPQSA